MRRALALAGLVLLAAPAAAASPPLAVTTSVDRASASVGDRLVVRIRVAFDPDAVDGVGAELAPGPLAPLGPPRLTRSDGRLELTQVVACLEAGCAPTAASRRVVVKAVAHGRARASGRAVSAAVPLSVTIVPRVAAAAVAARTPPYLRETALPPPRYRISPAALTGGLLALALLLLAVAIRVALPHRRAAAAVEPDRLARALRLVRESAGRGGEDRRRALDLLGETLEHRSEPGGEQALRLAWSPREPDGAETGRLADDVESSVGARS